MSGESFAVGVYTKCWLLPGTTTKAATYTHGALSVPIDFLAESLARHRIYAGARSIRGTRMELALHRRVTKYEYFGEIHKYISPGELDTLLTLALGPENTTDTWTAGPTAADEELPYFSALMQRDSSVFAAPATSIFQYDACKMDRFIIRGRAPQAGEEAEPSMITSTMRIVGCDQTEVALPGSLPALPTTGGYECYVFSDAESGITLEGVGSRPIQEFVIAIDNHCFPKYVNSLKPYAIRSQGRTIQVRFVMPWNDSTDDIYDAAAAGAAGIIKLTNTSRGVSRSGTPVVADT